MKPTIRFEKPRGTKGPTMEAVIEFNADAGLFSGFEMGGFAIWPSANNPSGYSVTMPSRPYEKDGKKEYFNYLRLRKDPNIPDKQKWSISNWIIEEFKKTLEEVPFK